MEKCVHEIDIFISAIGNFNITTFEYMKMKKNTASVTPICALQAYAKGLQVCPWRSASTRLKSSLPPLAISASPPSST